MREDKDVPEEKGLDEHHIPYARLQAIARRVGWPSEKEETHLVVCGECRDEIEKMRKATLGI